MVRTLMEIFSDKNKSPLSLEAAKEARDKGIKQVQDNADRKWQDTALAAVHQCAFGKESFIVDEVWEYMYDLHGAEQAHTRDNRAMGSIIVEAKKYGWITATNEYRPSARTKSHGNPRRVWKSLIYRQTEYQQGAMEL